MTDTSFGLQLASGLEAVASRTPTPLPLIPPSFAFDRQLDIARALTSTINSLDSWHSVRNYASYQGVNFNISGRLRRDDLCLELLVEGLPRQPYVYKIRDEDGDEDDDDAWSDEWGFDLSPLNDMESIPSNWDESDSIAVTLAQQEAQRHLEGMLCHKPLWHAFMNEENDREHLRRVAASFYQSLDDTRKFDNLWSDDEETLFHNFSKPLSIWLGDSLLSVIHYGNPDCRLPFVVASFYLLWAVFAPADSYDAHQPVFSLLRENLYELESKQLLNTPFSDCTGLKSRPSSLPRKEYGSLMDLPLLYPILHSPSLLYRISIPEFNAYNTRTVAHAFNVDCSGDQLIAYGLPFNTYQDDRCCLGQVVLNNADSLNGPLELALDLATATNNFDLCAGSNLIVNQFLHTISRLGGLSVFLDDDDLYLVVNSAISAAVDCSYGNQHRSRPQLVNRIPSIPFQENAFDLPFSADSGSTALLQPRRIASSSNDHEELRQERNNLSFLSSLFDLIGPPSAPLLSSEPATVTLDGTSLTGLVAPDRQGRFWFIDSATMLLIGQLPPHAIISFNSHD